MKETSIKIRAAVTALLGVNGDPSGNTLIACIKALLRASNATTADIDWAVAEIGTKELGRITAVHQLDVAAMGASTETMEKLIATFVDMGGHRLAEEAALHIGRELTADEKWKLSENRVKSIDLFGALDAPQGDDTKPTREDLLTPGA